MSEYCPFSRLQNSITEKRKIFQHDNKLEEGQRKTTNFIAMEINFLQWFLLLAKIVHETNDADKQDKEKNNLCGMMLIFNL